MYELKPNRKHGYQTETKDKLESTFHTMDRNNKAPGKGWMKTLQTGNYEMLFSGLLNHKIKMNLKG